MLQEIIDNDGMEKLMEVEEKIVSELQLKNCIESTGGSVIYSEKAMNVLNQGGQIIYLHVPYEEIKQKPSLKLIFERQTIFLGNSV